MQWLTFQSVKLLQNSPGVGEADSVIEVVMETVNLQRIFWTMSPNSCCVLPLSTTC